MQEGLDNCNHDERRIPKTEIQVEISKGRGNEDFSLAAKVDAKDGYNPSTTTVFTSRRAVGDPLAKLTAVLSGLRPSSIFNVRVSAISRYCTRWGSGVL